ncbi:MAG: hypothetical protein HC938_08240 [Nitrospira sp.]|nr:hypothetical protein [Nitrospira sp.]
MERVCEWNDEGSALARCQGGVVADIDTNFTHILEAKVPIALTQTNHLELQTMDSASEREPVGQVCSQSGSRLSIAMHC